MRRFRIIGLALMALFALGAISAAVVSAEEGILVGGGGNPSTFQVTGGTATLETLAKLAISCTKVTGNGIFLAKSDEHGTATLDFTGCKSSGFALTSLGDAAETILSKVLFLICLVEPKALVFGILILPLATEHIEVKALGSLILVKGALIAENLSGLNGDGGLGKVFKHELVGKGGDQTKALECESLGKKFKHTFESGFDSGADEHASETAALSITYPAAVELMDK